MKDERKNRKRIVVAAVIVALFVLLVLGGLSCKKEIEETGVQPVYGAYIQIEDAKLDTYALLAPRTVIAHDAQLKEPLTEQKLLEIFENQGLKPVGVRFASGELHGYLGFRNNPATFQEGMDYFWEVEIEATQKLYQRSLESLERAADNPEVTDETVQTKNDTIERTKRYHQRALNHQYTFEAVLFDASASTAKNFRNNHKNIILFIHSGRVE